jgi:hypothetical protein
MQMLFANVLIDAVDTTLEDREVSLGIVSVSIASDVFILRMNDGPMAGKFLTGFPIDTAFVSAKMRSFIDPIPATLPDQLISHLAAMIAEAPASDLVVDVGAGTGIFTRQLRAAPPLTYPPPARDQVRVTTPSAGSRSRP